MGGAPPARGCSMERCKVAASRGALSARDWIERGRGLLRIWIDHDVVIERKPKLEI